jgi:Mg2+ and Co2+ transporter CorA
MVLSNAQNRTKHAQHIDFVGLHNISKQSIYLLESTSSLLSIIDGLLNTISLSSEQSNLRDALSYNRSAVNATRTRLISLDKRITNLIALSFNLVTQSDSRTLKADSKLMILIAVVTMVFLPTNTIASIFGSSFFEAQLADPASVLGDRLVVLPQFWLFWAVCVPLTGVIMGLGILYWRYVKRVHLAGVERHRE